MNPKGRLNRDQTPDLDESSMLDESILDFSSTNRILAGLDSEEQDCNMIG